MKCQKCNIEKSVGSWGSEMCWNIDCKDGLITHIHTATLRFNEYASKGADDAEYYSSIKMVREAIYKNYEPTGK